MREFDFDPAISGDDAKNALIQAGYKGMEGPAAFGFVRVTPSTDGSPEGGIYPVPRVITHVHTPPAGDTREGTAEHFDFDPKTGVAISLGLQPYTEEQITEDSGIDHSRTFTGEPKNPALVDHSTTTIGDRAMFHSGAFATLSAIGPNVVVGRDSLVRQSEIGVPLSPEETEEGRPPRLTSLGEETFTTRATVLPGTAIGDKTAITDSTVSGTLGPDNVIDKSTATGVTTGPEVKITNGSTVTDTALERGSSVTGTQLGPNNRVGQYVTLTNTTAQTGNTFGDNGTYTDAAIGSNSSFGHGAYVEEATIKDHVRAGDHVQISGTSGHEKPSIGDYAHIGPRARITGPTVLRDGTANLVDDNGVRVGQDTGLAGTTVQAGARIGERVSIPTGTQIGADVIVSDNVTFNGIRKVGSGAFIGVSAQVEANIPVNGIVAPAATITRTGKTGQVVLPSSHTTLPGLLGKRHFNEKW
jgi:acetyltransferase-like isoleucine patch superfamily enzyme